MKVGFDCAAFIWNALKIGVDKEHGREVLFNDKKTQVNSGGYGYDIATDRMLDVMKWAGVQPHQCILVFEGMHSKKLRQAIDPLYKVGRDHAPEEYAEYQIACEMLMKAWREVGACAVKQDFAEGDDVLGYLAANTEEDLVVATLDNDLLVLAGTNEYGATTRVWVNGKVDTNPYGSFDLKLITCYKALVGDTTDKIKGVVGFGKKSWDEFLIAYGDEGAEELARLLDFGQLGELHKQREESRLIRLICEQEAGVMKCWKLAKIHPEWVNNRTRVLQFFPGMVMPQDTIVDERLRPFGGQAWLVSRENWEELSAFCLGWFDHSPFVALDIETSTPPESDEWLAAQGDPEGIDVLGSTLTGLSLTFGPNLNYTVYITVGHLEEPGVTNVSSEQVRQLVAAIPRAKKKTVIQNIGFELAVLYNEWGERQEDNGANGFLPGVLDTKFEASYVNENIKNGLKLRSKEHLGYTQKTYIETMSRTGDPDELPKGGRLIAMIRAEKYVYKEKEITQEEAEVLDAAGEEVFLEPAEVTRLYKMNEVLAREVFAYGCDDTICTAGLHVFYELVMHLEHTWNTYLEFEIDAAYMSTAGFIQGTDFSVAKMRELMAEDDKTHAAAWATLREFLMAHGWEGSVCPVYSPDSKPAELKIAYKIVTGKTLDTAVRKIDKLAKLMEAEGAETLATLLMGGDWNAFNQYVANHFKGEPEFNIDSFKQKQVVMYDLLKLPVVMRGEATEAMKTEGTLTGNAKTDTKAIDWALKFDAKEEDKPILMALKLIMMVSTRYKLYYDKYPGFLHWKTGKLHSQFNQCEANTRRSSDSKPNKQQWPKHQKIEGQPARFRETIVPHHANAVIVSLDEDAQELRIIADYSEDPGMVACFVGDNKKKMHAMTAVGIALRRWPKIAWTYDLIMEAYKDKNHKLHAYAEEAYALGKKVNFTTEYGAMAKKVSETLIETQEDSQAFIDAKMAAFPVAAAWKDKVIEELRTKGYVKTKGGAMRHLRDALNSNDGYEASKAERQGVNMKVQGSAAEQTKGAYGDAWRRELIFKYDCTFIGPVHDEVVWSVAIPDLFAFLSEMHAGMVRPYGNMKIPIVSSISFGPSFGAQFEAGNTPDPKALAVALGEMCAYHPRYRDVAAQSLSGEILNAYESSLDRTLRGTVTLAA